MRDQCDNCNGWGEVSCPDCEDRVETGLPWSVVGLLARGCSTCDEEKMIPCPVCSGSGMLVESDVADAAPPPTTGLGDSPTPSPEIGVIE